jgi:hypothetical protein
MSSPRSTHHTLFIEPLEDRVLLNGAPDSPKPSPGSDDAYASAHVQPHTPTDARTGAATTPASPVAMSPVADAAHPSSVAYVGSAPGHDHDDDDAQLSQTLPVSFVTLPSAQHAISLGVSSTDSVIHASAALGPSVGLIQARPAENPVAEPAPVSSGETTPASEVTNPVESGTTARDHAEEIPPPAPTPSPATTAPAMVQESGDPLVGLLPINLGQLQQGIDTIFEQLGELGRELPGNTWSLPATVWLLVAAVAVEELLRNRRPRPAQLPEMPDFLTEGEE